MLSVVMWNITSSLAGLQVLRLYKASTLDMWASWCSDRNMKGQTSQAEKQVDSTGECIPRICDSICDLSGTISLKY